MPCLQASVAALLNDSAFVHSFIGENCKRMAATYAGLTAAADAAGLAYHPAVAAMFLWLDLRKELRAPEWQEERALWQQLVDRGVVLTPGAPCGLVSAGGPVVASTSSRGSPCVVRFCLAPCSLLCPTISQACVRGAGQDCLAPEPGYFRVCWAAAPLPALEQAVSRISSQLHVRRAAQAEL